MPREPTIPPEPVDMEPPPVSLALKLFIGLMLATMAALAIGFAPRDRVPAVSAEVLPPPSASVPKPRPCGAEGALPGDYGPSAKVLP